MGMTITQKILKDHLTDPKQEVEPGAIVEVKVDFAFANDITGPIAIKQFKEAGAERVFDPNRVAIITDHFTPNKDIKSAMQVKTCRLFARDQQIWFWNQGEIGIEHILLPEQGLALPGDIIIGADSHTCTYGALGAFATGMGSTDVAYIWIFGKTWLKVPPAIKFVYHGKRKKWVSGKDLILYTIRKIGVDGALYKTMEFTGEAVKELNMNDRFTMANMAIEAGAKNGIFEPDEKTLEYVKGRARRSYKLHNSDENAKYEDVIEIDVSKIELQVAKPHLPENSVPVQEVENTHIDQVVIGSCTNGHLEDLEVVARILEGKKVHPDVRLLIFPGSPTILRQALEKGYLKIFLDAGAVISPPTCGPCLGGHMGILAEGEVALSTTNRNFVGRMGHPKSLVYLTSPAVAAASAVAGKIVHPDSIVKE